MAGCSKGRKDIYAGHIYLHIINAPKQYENPE